MAADYRENPGGLAEMLRAPFMVEALRKVAERGAARASDNTPVDTGQMKASWKTWAGVRDGRAMAQIYNTARSPQGAPYPLFLERGTRYIRKRRILGRAIDDMATRP